VCCAQYSCFLYLDIILSWYAAHVFSEGLLLLLLLVLLLISDKEHSTSLQHPKPLDTFARGNVIAPNVLVCLSTFLEHAKGYVLASAIAVIQIYCFYYLLAKVLHQGGTATFATAKTVFLHFFCQLTFYATVALRKVMIFVHQKN
jgi:hypothetical protein